MMRVRVGRLRVGIDYRPALLSSSGIARAVRELARALSASGDIDLHLFGHSWSAAARGDGIPDSASLHRLPIPGRWLPALARAGLDAATLCGRPAAFHWTDYVHPPVTHTPLVLTLHDVAFAVAPEFHGEQTAELRARTRDAIDRARLVITPTAATAAAAIAAFEVPRERFVVIPFGVDHAAAGGGERPLAEPYVIAVGTVEPRKNHLRLLQAWDRLAQPRPRLVVVGRRGWNNAAAIAELERRRAAAELDWHESMRDDELFRWLEHAELCVYPSLHEGFGFPPLEAAALGTPVVAGDDPALREVLATAARFCDPTDVDDLRAAIDEVLHDTTLRQRLREQGRQRARSFTWSRCAAEHVAAYRRAAGDG